VQTPSVDDVRAVTQQDVLAVHGERMAPTGATLVLCGDIAPEAALDAAEKALGGWSVTSTLITLPSPPPLVIGPLELVHRADSVQSSLRLALPAVIDRSAARRAAVGQPHLRWIFLIPLTENIREDKGCHLAPLVDEHWIAGSTTTLSVEVATDVTAPALLETTPNSAG
jgi:predicted Zn-dependent peptidase